MSLQLVLGGSGSGKSHWLYTWITQEAIRHPEKKYIVIVPEQFTMQTQREMVKLHPAHGILNIDILSFQRLAYRVFEETGTSRRTVLTETGKNLLLRKVASEKRNELPFLGSRLDRPGYISEIKSILSELAQYEISDEEMEDMVGLAASRPQLQYKLKDIRTLQQGFREYQREQFITAEELLNVFCQAADSSKMLKESVLAFDSFTGFTPVQQNALRRLLSLVPEVKIALTLGAGENPVGRAGEHELFYMSKKTIHTLYDLARETGTEIIEPVVLSGEKGRFRKGSAIGFLEQHLFRYGKTEVFQGKEVTEISLHTARNPMEEVRFAACEINRLTKEQGLRYRDIAVIAGDLPSYANYVKKLFREHDIPCFVDQTVQILLNPCLEFVRGAFGVVDLNFSYESVFRLLRTGFAGFTQEETDRLENYVLALGIRGKNGWEREWSGETLSMQPGEASVCDGYRSRLMESLGPWLQMQKAGRAPLRDYAEALYDLLVSFGIQEQLKQQEEIFRQQGQAEKAREYSQIYSVLIDLLDEAVDLLGTETVSRKEFEDILEAGFSEARVGIIPPGIDQVHVGDMERTRLNHIKVLFFLGLNDGWVPSKEGRGGIVSELEREFLHQEGVELAPTARENSYIQRFYLYLGLTKPGDRLYLSCCKTSSEGTAMRPSYLISSIRRLFPSLRMEDEDEDRDLLHRITSPETGISLLAEELRELRKTEEKQKEEPVRELLRQYYRKDSGRQRARELVNAAFLVPEDQYLRQATARDLYGELLENSVTRLEEFASCAFAHYAAYGLGLSEREIYQVRSADIGTVFHRALELFAGKLERSGYDWFTIPDQVRDEWVGQCAREAVSLYGSGVFFSSARNRYMIERISRILQRSVWALHEQVKAGSFVPANFEITFTGTEALDAVNIALGETEKMRLKGRIDRIDLYEDGDRIYVKVVDYKSGNTSFDLTALYYGLQLQLVVYLNAAMELERRVHPDKEIIPAGIFYYRLKDPLPEGSHDLTPAEQDDALLKLLRPDGIVNEDPAVVEKMDACFEKTSRMIPVGRKADGSWSAASSVASEKQLEELSGFVQDKLKQLGKDILEGKIQVNPYRRKKGSACDYCAFADLCGFDLKVPGTAYRQLGEFSRQEIWEKIMPEEER